MTSDPVDDNAGGDGGPHMRGPDVPSMDIDVTVPFPADFAEKVAAELAKNNRFPILTSTTDPNPNTLAEMWREAVRDAGPGQVLSNAFEVRNQPFELTPADVVAACRTATAMCEEARKLIDRAVDTIRRATESKAVAAARGFDFKAEQAAIAAESRYQADVNAFTADVVAANGGYRRIMPPNYELAWPPEFGQFPLDPNLLTSSDLLDAGTEILRKSVGIPAVVEHKESP